MKHKLLRSFSSLALVLLFASAFAHAQCPVAPTPSTQSTSVSGTPLIFNNACGGTGTFFPTFEEKIAGAPATVSIPAAGCMRGGTCDTLETYTTVANSNRAPTASKVYDYFTVTPSWTGGTSVVVTVNYSANPFARGPSSGGNGNATTVNGAAVPASDPVLGSNGSGQLIPSTSTSIIGLFSACSGTQSLGADGACHTNASLPTAPSSNGVQSVVFPGASGAATTAYAGVAVDPNGETTCAAGTLSYLDRTGYIKCSGGTTATFALAQIVSGTNTGSNLPFVLQNLNTGALTVTANAADSVDGGSLGGSIILPPNYAAYFYQDSTSAPGHWWTIRFGTIRKSNGVDVASLPGATWDAQLSTCYGLIAIVATNVCDMANVPAGTSSTSPLTPAGGSVTLFPHVLLTYGNGFTFNITNPYVSMICPQNDRGCILGAQNNGAVGIVNVAASHVYMQGWLGIGGRMTIQTANGQYGTGTEAKVSTNGTAIITDVIFDHTQIQQAGSAAYNFTDCTHCGAINDAESDSSGLQGFNFNAVYAQVEDDLLRGCIVKDANINSLAGNGDINLQSTGGDQLLKNTEISGCRVSNGEQYGASGTATVSSGGAVVWQTGQQFLTGSPSPMLGWHIAFSVSGIPYDYRIQSVADVTHLQTTAAFAQTAGTYTFQIYAPASYPIALESAGNVNTNGTTTVTWTSGGSGLKFLFNTATITSMSISGVQVSGVCSTTCNLNQGTYTVSGATGGTNYNGTIVLYYASVGTTFQGVYSSATPTGSSTGGTLSGSAWNNGNWQLLINGVYYTIASVQSTTSLTTTTTVPTQSAVAYTAQPIPSQYDTGSSEGFQETAKVGYANFHDNWLFNIGSEGMVCGTGNCKMHDNFLRNIGMTTTGTGCGLQSIQTPNSGFQTNITVNGSSFQNNHCVDDSSFGVQGNVPQLLSGANPGGVTGYCWWSNVGGPTSGNGNFIVNQLIDGNKCDIQGNGGITNGFEFTNSSVKTDALSGVVFAAGVNTFTCTTACTNGASNGLLGDLMQISGFVNGINNGSFTVTGSTGTTFTVANASGITEANPGSATGGATVTLTNDLLTNNTFDPGVAVPLNIGYDQTITGRWLLGNNSVGGSTIQDQGTQFQEISNASTTGTTLNKLAKLTGAPSTAVKAATTDTSGILGPVYGETGSLATNGLAVIAVSGQANCVFDGFVGGSAGLGTVAGDYVQISPNVAGDCTDAGSTLPASGQIVGRVLSTNGSAGTYLVLLTPGAQGNGNLSAGSPFTVGQILVAQDATHAKSSGIIPCGAGCVVYVNVSGGDFTTTSATLANITGLTFSLAASTNYAVSCYLRYSEATSSTALQFGFQDSTAPTSVGIFGLALQSAASPSILGSAIGGTTANSLGSFTPTVTTALPGYFNGVIEQNTAGTLNIMADIASGIVLTIKRDSFCRIEVVQ